jgi:hypothetical protein
VELADLVWDAGPEASNRLQQGFLGIAHRADDWQPKLTDGLEQRGDGCGIADAHVLGRQHPSTQETITNRGLTVREGQRVSFLARPQQQCISC